MSADVRTHPQPSASFVFRERVVQGPLARYCARLVAVDVEPAPEVLLSVIPHGSFLLTVQLGNREPFESRPCPGALPHLCRVRTAAESYRPPGDCRTFFAQLTPEGAITLAGSQPMPAATAPRFPLHTLLPSRDLAVLEDSLAGNPDVTTQLHQLGAWLENRLVVPARLPSTARRAVEAAADVLANPCSALPRVLARHAASRRQLERDLRNWLQISPKQLHQVARVQRALGMARRGMRMADVAQATGFSDQAHMCRVIGAMAGRSPGVLLRECGNRLSDLFRRYAGGDVVYVARELVPSN